MPKWTDIILFSMLLTLVIFVITTYDLTMEELKTSTAFRIYAPSFKGNSLQSGLPFSGSTFYRQENYRHGDCHTDTLQSRSILGNLSHALFKHIEQIMNPMDCETAKFLLCEWPTMVWGLGSVTHHILYCLSIAVSTNRILLIEAKNFFPRTWSSYFLQPSEKCWNRTIESYVDWYDLEDIETSHEQVVRLFFNTTKYFNRTKDYPDMMPYNFIRNKTMYNQIQGNHKLPELWIVSQLVKYLYQLNSNFKKRLERTKELIGYRHPIVGVHIRRGDKIREAPPVPTNIYMEQVAKYYEHASKTMHKPRVYLASDDAEVYNETKDKYKEYRFVYIDPDTGGRKLDRAVADLFLLADSDFFIGTFSSSFGRLIHELRQQKYENGACMGISLDRGYHYNSCCDIRYKLKDIHINCSYDNITKENTLRQLL